MLCSDLLVMCPLICLKSAGPTDIPPFTFCKRFSYGTCSNRVYVCEMVMRTMYTLCLPVYRTGTILSRQLENRIIEKYRTGTALRFRHQNCTASTQTDLKTAQIGPFRQKRIIK